MLARQAAGAQEDLRIAAQFRREREENEDRRRIEEEDRVLRRRVTEEGLVASREERAVAARERERAELDRVAATKRSESFLGSMRGILPAGDHLLREMEDVLPGASTPRELAGLIAEYGPVARRRAADIKAGRDPDDVLGAGLAEYEAKEKIQARYRPPTEGGRPHFINPGETGTWYVDPRTGTARQVIPGQARQRESQRYRAEQTALQMVGGGYVDPGQLRATVQALVEQLGAEEAAGVSGPVSGAAGQAGEVATMSPELVTAKQAAVGSGANKRALDAWVAQQRALGVPDARIAQMILADVAARGGGR
jgi:hypothetical protein